MDLEKLRNEKTNDIKQLEDVLEKTKEMLDSTGQDLINTRTDKKDIARNKARYSISQKCLEELNSEKRELCKIDNPNKIHNNNLKQNFQDYLLLVKLIECIIGMIAFFMTVTVGYLLPFMVIIILMLTDFVINISPLKKNTDNLMFKVYKKIRQRSLNKKIKYQKQISNDLSEVLSSKLVGMEELTKNEEKLLKTKKILEEELSTLESLLREEKQEKIDIDAIIHEEDNFDKTKKVYQKNIS